MRKISVLIPVYNALEYTKICIENVEMCLGYRPYEIIVVDNASTDGTAEYLAEKDRERRSTMWESGMKAFSLAAAVC